MNLPKLLENRRRQTTQNLSVDCTKIQPIEIKVINPKSTDEEDDEWHYSTMPDEWSKSKTDSGGPELIQAPESPLFRISSRPRLTLTAHVPSLRPNSMPVDPFREYQPLVKSL